ncbi:glycosyltransferase family 2 protein [Flavobacterium sp. 3-210]
MKLDKFIDKYTSSISPIVSIIIPTYNRAHFISETLDSIATQTYTNWECIIVDDGSTDNSELVISKYVELDSRFKLYRRPKDKVKGANSCRNFGFEQSVGKYIQYLDSDDYISSNKIEKQVNELEKCDVNTIAICKWQFFGNSSDANEGNEGLKVYSNFDSILDFIDALALSGCFLPPHTYLINRQLVLNAGNWMDRLEINQDGEFFARIFIKTNKVVYVPDAKVFYRRNNIDNVSILNNEKKIEHALLSWQLIESYFKIHFGESTRLVSISKKYLYQRIVKENIETIKKNKLFFKEEICSNDFFFIRVLKKMLKGK